MLRSFYVPFSLSRQLSCFFYKNQTFCSVPPVLDQENMQLKDIVSRLNKYASLSMAESWDNVGLLVEPYGKTDYKKIFLTNDLTEEVLQECIESQADFILSYHPPVFKPLKCVTQKHWKERIVSLCLQKGIAIYSPHTAYDALVGGVNDWLVRAFGDAQVSPINKSLVSPKFDHEISFLNIVDEEYLLDILKKLKVKNASNIMINEKSFCVYVTKQALPIAVKYLDEIFPIKNFVVKSCDSSLHPEQGMGRLARLNSETKISDVISKVKSMTGLSHVRVAMGVYHSLNKKITSGAVCAGSGISVLRKVDAQVLITGEMSHHDILEFTQTNRTVLLLEHSNSERGYLSNVLKPQLNNIFGAKVEVEVSKKDRDPIVIV